MAHHHTWRTMVAKPAGIRPSHWLLIAGYALLVAGGAKVVSLPGNGMMGVALVGAWLMFALGLAYAGVRLRPSTGGALLIGFGIGAVLVVLFAGMGMAG